MPSFCSPCVQGSESERCLQWIKTLKLAPGTTLHSYMVVTPKDSLASTLHNTNKTSHCGRLESTLHSSKRSIISTITNHIHTNKIIAQSRRKALVTWSHNLISSIHPTCLIMWCFFTFAHSSIDPSISMHSWKTTGYPANNPVHPCSRFFYSVSQHISARSDFLTRESHSNLLVTESQPSRQSLSSILNNTIRPPVRPFIGLLTYQPRDKQCIKQICRRKQRAPNRASFMNIKHFDPSNPFWVGRLFRWSKWNTTKQMQPNLHGLFVGEHRKGSIMQTLPNLWRCTNWRIMKMLHAAV